MWITPVERLCGENFVKLFMLTACSKHTEKGQRKSGALLSLVFLVFLFQMLFQNEVDVLGQGTAVVVCLFSELYQNITVDRDTDFLF